MTSLGIMAVIQLPNENEIDWYCDLCSDKILISWGGEAWPVPMLGSYALCLEHFNIFSQPINLNGLQAAIEEGLVSGDKVPLMSSQDIAFHPEYEAGDGYGMGPWPLSVCGCGACELTGIEWRPIVERILDRANQEAIWSN